MKQIVLFLLCVFLPMNLLAGDVCTSSPDKYLVDKRCYVTDAQIKTKPYNAVALVLREGAVEGGNCTGTIVKENEKLYLYTAKHCTDLNDDGYPDMTLKVKLPDGTKVTASKYGTGNLNLRTKANLSGDWAVYSLDNVDTASVSRGKVKNGGIRVIGFGRLKIMSDLEIRDFRERYATWLVENNTTKIGSYGMSGKAVDTNNNKVETFISQLEPSYYNKVFNDTKLKVSNCTYVNGAIQHCQGWHGDSGGGIFDKSGNVVGIVSYGENYIGSVNNHAKLNGAVFW